MSVSTEKINFFRVTGLDKEYNPEMSKANAEVKTRGFYQKPENWFETKKEALANYKKAYKEASVKFKEICLEQTKLQEKLGFQIDYFMNGDTHGIHEDGMYVEFKHSGYEFRFSI